MEVASSLYSRPSLEETSEEEKWVEQRIYCIPLLYPASLSPVLHPYLLQYQ